MLNAQNKFFELEHLDLTLLRKKAQMMVKYSINRRTGNTIKKYEAESLKKEIEDKEKSLECKESMTLNKFINYIELTLDCIGTIDPLKITTSRAFSLYHQASEKNEAIIKQNRNVGHSKY